MTEAERRELLRDRTSYTQKPLRAPKIRAPKGLLGFLVVALLFPVVIPLMVLVSVTYTAITRRTNKY
jgi:hypothetical protein